MLLFTAYTDKLSRVERHADELIDGDVYSQNPCNVEIILNTDLVFIRAHCWLLSYEL